MDADWGNFLSSTADLEAPNWHWNPSTQMYESDTFTVPRY